VRLAREAGVELRFGVLVRDLAPAAASEVDERWTLRTENGMDLHAHSVILATGGLSVPATGSDGTGLRVARRLGHTVHDTYPALTPLTADPPVRAALAGVSLSVTLTAPGARGSFVTRGGFLFTHRGYSGPAVLDISHVAVQAKLRLAAESEDHGGAGFPSIAQRRAPKDVQPILVQWTEHDTEQIERHLSEAGAVTVGALARRLLPHRLADTLVAEATVASGTPLSQLRRDARQRIVRALAAYELPWSGDEGYKKAEVTGGGVSLADVDPRTLQSRKRPGLYLCGELLDAFGPIGGYNFAWAFATGRLAGQGAAE
jgi:predicted flavoprotein YhiN